MELGHRLLVVFDEASPEARSKLRGRRISYASPSGEIFLTTPDLLVDRPAVLPAGHSGSTGQLVAPRDVSPFAKRAARVPRWLLLHSDQRPTIGELAARAELSRPFTSQVVRALAERGFVELTPKAGDARARRVQLTRAGELLDDWTAEWRRRRQREVTWDVGTADVTDTIAAWSEAARHRGDMRWALGGLAGAERIARVTEPPEVLVWIDPADLIAWEHLLLPERRRRGQAPLRVASARDPWTLGLAADAGGVRIADATQLYLDCRGEGERALEAARTIRDLYGW